jgi:Tfp pilus assembly protein PilX
MSKRLRQEEGIALVMALSITVVLIIFVASMISYTSQSSRNSNVSRSRLVAQTISESGIGVAASIINKAANATDPALLGCTASGVNSALPCTDITVAVPGGTAYLHGMYSQVGNAGTWTITSYGSVVNPTGSTNLTKRITATMSVTGGGQGNNISVWNYVYSTAVNGGGCEVDQTGNGAVIDVPIFVTGDLCLSADGSAIKENLANGGQKIDVRVLGKLVMSAPTATVGTSAAYVTSGLISGGCTTSTGGTGHPCTTADKYYVTTTDSLVTAAPPTVDYTGWYQNASPGPKHPCDAGTVTASKFDSNTTMDGTTPVFDLTPSTSYTCTTLAGGVLSWDATTKILLIGGTIFFDGNVVASSTAAKYHGKATIYVNGTFTMSAANASLRAGCPASPALITKACAFASTAKEWDPNIDNLIIAAAAKNNSGAIALTGQSVNVQAELLCDATSTADLQGDTLQHEGAFICGKFLWGQNIQLMPLPSITQLPPGAPVPPNAPATIGTPVITSGS